MRIHTTLCTTEQQWHTLSQFYLQHYKSMNDTLPVKQALYDLVTFIQEGQAISIFIEEQIVGSILYRIDDNILYFHSIMCAEQYRLTRVFYRGWQAVFTHINCPITKIHFIAVAANAYTNRLYRKFAHYTHTTSDDNHVEHHHYEMSWSEFCSTLERMERRKG